ncbi:MAG: LptF/LptG family permease [Planctomycetota bacterium]
MGILTRYVASEGLKLLAVAMASLTTILSVSMAAKEAVRLGMPPMVVLKAMPYFCVEMLGYAMPASVLYVVCSVYGRMAADNELVAIKSMGINPLRIVTPTLAAAFLISLGTVLAYDATAVWGRPGVRTLMAESAAEVAEGLLATNKSIDMPWGSIAVRGVEGGVLIEPSVRLKRKGGAGETVLDAGRGDLESDANGVRLVLLDSEAAVRGGASVLHPGRFEIDFPIENQGTPVHRDWLAQRDIPSALAEVEADLRQVELRDLRLGVDSDDAAFLRRKIARLRAEPYRRWANGFSCFAFALVGVAVAMRLKTADAIATFFAAFLPVLLVFYPMLMMSEKMACSGDWPPSIFWLSDGVLGLAGGGLLWRVIRR